MSSKKETFQKYRKAVARNRKKDIKRLSDQITLENLPLCTRLANRFRQKWGLDIIPFEDMQQAAISGMLEALRRYDPERSKFSSYAGDWIRHELQNIAKQYGHDLRGRCVVPAAKIREMLDFEARNGRLPQAEEMGVTQPIWDAIQAPAPIMISIDSSFIPDEGADELTLIERIGDMRFSPESQLDKNTLIKAFKKLSPRERELFLAYVDGANKRTLSQIAGCSIKDIPSKIERARRKLEQALA